MRVYFKITARAEKKKKRKKKVPNQPAFLIHDPRGKYFRVRATAKTNKFQPIQLHPAQKNEEEEKTAPGPLDRQTRRWVAERSLFLFFIFLFLRRSLHRCIVALRISTVSLQ